MASKSFSENKLASNSRTSRVSQRDSMNISVEESEELTEEGQRILEYFVIERLQQDGVQQVLPLSAMHPVRSNSRRSLP